MFTIWISSFFIMSHEYYLDFVKFYLSNVLTKFVIQIPTRIPETKYRNSLEYRKKNCNGDFYLLNSGKIDSRKKLIRFGELNRH